MIEIEIPDYRKITLENLVCDYNGTLAIRGSLINGVDKILKKLSKTLKIYVITGNTYVRISKKLKETGCEIIILNENAQSQQKLDFINQISAESVVAIGNGRNDILMVKHSALGIAVLQEEGAAKDLILEADIVVKDINSALSLLLHPIRLKASLRG